MMKRTFIAIKIPLSKITAELIHDIKFKLRDEKIKWVESWNLHITLFFLGDTEDDLIEKVKKGLFAILKDIKSFKLKCSGVGVFKNIHNPKALWFGIEKSEKLNELKYTVDKLMSSIGFKTEDKEFRPHLTIARTKHIKEKNLIKELVHHYQDENIQEIEVNEVLFYESKLTPKGPVYSVLTKVSLS